MAHYIEEQSNLMKFIGSFFRCNCSPFIDSIPGECLTIHANHVPTDPPTRYLSQGHVCLVNMLLGYN